MAQTAETRPAATKLAAANWVATVPTVPQRMKATGLPGPTLVEVEVVEVEVEVVEVEVVEEEEAGARPSQLRTRGPAVN